MHWHRGITAWHNQCLLQFSLLLLPSLPQHLQSWASCSQRSQHLTPLRHCSSDGFMDFSSCSSCLRAALHCKHLPLPETTSGESPQCLDQIGHEPGALGVRAVVGPPGGETQRRGCALPAAPGSSARQSPRGTRSCSDAIDSGKCWALPLRISQSCFPAGTKGF